MKHSKLSAKILSLALSAAMLLSTMPATVFATGGDASGEVKDSGTVENQPAQEQCSCNILCTEEKINAECKVCAAVDADLAACKGVAAAEKTAYDKVVELFTALPSASVITAETTEEQKDVIIAQLTAAMGAFDALTAEEQDKFLAEQAALYTAAMALNDAITGASPAPLANAITITVNDDKTGGGATLQAAITASTVAPAAVTALKITAGTVTVADWEHLATLTALADFEIADDTAVTSVADIPIGESVSASTFPKSIVNVTVPQAITIGKYSFVKCKLLKTANFPKATIIGEDAFTECGALETANFLEATSIGMNAFYGCKQLKTATIAKVKNIAKFSFERCTALAKLELGATPPGVADKNAFSEVPAGGELVYLDGDGNKLKGGALATAQAAYKAAADGSTTDDTWYGWKIIPAALSISFDARNGETIADVTAGVEDKIVLPTAPTWDYTFAGWYTGIDGAGTAVTADTVHNASATVYAKWTKGGKTVRTEKLWVGAFSKNESDPNQGWSWDFENRILTITDFTLDAKHTGSDTAVSDEIDLSSNSTLKVIGTNTVIASDIKTDTVYTNAIAGSGSLAINGAGTLNASAKTYAITATAWGDITISEATINAESTRGDMGYAISTDGKITIENTATVSAKSNNVAFDGKAGIFAEGATVTGANETFTSGATKELTPSDRATPVVISFTKSISFDARNGETIADAKITDGKITMPANPEWGDYTFAGWYTDKDYTTEFVNSNLAASATVYAKWTKGGKSVRTTTLKLDDSTAAIDALSTEGWKWDAGTNTLTLSGFTMNSREIDTNNISNGIYFDATLGPVTIILTDGTENTVDVSSVGDVTYTAALYADGKLKIETSGNGTPGKLNAIAGTATDSSVGIMGLAGVTIESGTIVATGGESANASSIGIAADSGDIHINGGTVRATGGESGGNGMAGSFGLYAGNVLIDGGTVTAIGGIASLSGGIVGTTDVTLNGGTINAKGNVAAVAAFGELILEDGTVNGLPAKIVTNSDLGISIKTIVDADNTLITDAKIRFTPAYTGTEAVDPDASKAIRTTTSITLEAQKITGETVEYGIQSAGGEIAWQDSPVFTGLTADTEYTVYARVKATDAHSEGATSVGAKIKTKSTAENLADAEDKADTALDSFTATNDATAEDILAAVNNALSGTGVTAGWKTPSDFSKTPATESAAGSIKGTIEITLNGEKIEVTVDLPIAKLTADKTALTDAIADASNAKIGIITNNGTPDSVANGTKFVSDAEMKALADAIAAAQLVANNPDATSAEAAAAANALQDAVAAFTAAIKTGTYTSSGGGNSGSGSGNSGSGGGSSSGGNSVITARPDTTQPKPPTTVETKIPATVDQNGNATVNVTDKAMQDAIDKAVTAAKKNGTSGNGVTVVINVTTGGKDASTVTVNLPKTVQEKVIAGNVVSTVVVVDRPDIAINMNLATIMEINKQAKSDVQLSATRLDNTKLSAEAKTAIGTRPTFDLKATYASGAKSVTNFGAGSVTIEIPYTLQKGESAGGLYAAYVDGSGKVNYITNSVYDANAKVLRFATNHFSVYGIGYKAPAAFTDITNHWAKADIEYIVAHGLIGGTSTSTFSPNAAMTRGAFAKALTALSGKEMTAVVGGNMANTVTREQMAVIIESYAKATGYTLPGVHAEKTFADSNKISAGAKSSVKKMQMAGVISGKSGNVFDPQGIATRAEAAAAIRRFTELVLNVDSAQGWTTNDSGKQMYYENGKAVTGKKTIAGKAYEFSATGELI